MDKYFVLTFIVGIFTIISVWGILSSRKRRKALEALAYSVGLSFRKSDRLDIGDAKFSIGFHGRRVRNVISGHLDDANIWLFSYDIPGAGQYGGQSERTVALFSSESIYLPDFDLQPESIGDKIKSTFGYQDIDFESHSQFSFSYLLRGEAEYAIRRIFTDEVLTFFSNHTGLYVEARGNKLIYYRGKRVKTRDMPSFLDEGKTIFDLFRRSQDR
jgi:hypothetical protein